MTWSKIDDGFFDHPKVLRAGEDAANLYVRALVWCNKHLTDGEIPREALRVLTSKRDAEKSAERLVAVGLWESTPDGWFVHDFHAHNPKREEVEARRADLSAKRAEAGRKGGVRSGLVRGVEAFTEANAKQVASSVSKQNGSPVPSRPVQTEENSPSGSAEGATAPAPPASAETASAAHTTSTGSEPTATKPTRARRAKPTPQPDTIPAPNTLARRVYDAILSDAALRPIVGNPGDAAERWADPAAFPGVDVLAEVKRAGDYASTKPGRYTDGRAFLRGWLQRKADEHAAQPKPAATTSAVRPATVPPNDLQIRLRAMREEQARKDAANGR